MMTSDPIMDRLSQEERAFTRKLLVVVTVWALISGAFGWWISTWPPRPIVMQFDGPLRVHVTLEKLL